MTRAQVTAELRELIRPRPARGASLIVEGAPGVGKTTLVTSCVADAARSGARIISAAADEFTVRQPFASVAALLESDRPSGTDPVQTAAERIDELCSQGPVLIWIDDAQYLDSASLSVLIRLWPSTRDLPLTIILSTRPLGRRSGLELLAGQASARLTLPPMNGGRSRRVGAQACGWPSWTGAARSTGHRRRQPILR
jgi:type II secretory pathway predicted ATPase ExeA